MEKHTSECDSAEIGERNQRASGREVLDDPLGIGLAKRVRFARECVGDGLSSRHVLDNCSTSLGRRSGDGHGDGVTSADGDACESIGIVRVPLIRGL